MWPVVKANAYGHGADIVARHLVGSGYGVLGVADVGEAVALKGAGIDARFVILSATLPEHSRAIVEHSFEPVVCTRDMVDALARDAAAAEREIAVHVKVDTGMGRVGIAPGEVVEFLAHCASLPAVRVRGLMSHFPRADEADKEYSEAQLGRFREIVEATRGGGIEVYHMANSAAILDLPDSYFDAVRPGIAMYGLAPSAEMVSPLVAELQPVLELKSRITFLKEVPPDTGLSYGHAFHTKHPSLIATVPVGYGDGVSRALSNDIDVLVHGRRCRQVGNVTMDMSLVDVTPLRGRVSEGDPVTIIGREGAEEITADELAAKLDTINYEIVTRIGQRVPRVADA
jgi:alanine racemase